MYYRDARVAIIMFDITSTVIIPSLFSFLLFVLSLPFFLSLLFFFDISPKLQQTSFEKAKFWVGELKGAGRKDVLIAFVGNKTDLEEQREVPTQEAKKYAAENNLIFQETSAKANMNVMELFTALGFSFFFFLFFFFFFLSFSFFFSLSFFQPKF